MSHTGLYHFWIVRQKNTTFQPICGIISAETGDDAIEYFVRRDNLDENSLEAEQINFGKLVEIIGPDTIKCLTKREPAEHVQRYANEIKPHECKTYASVCVSWEGEDDYLCQNCQRNRGFCGLVA